jgi:RNase H-like domain found in reverse transcriptase
MQECTDALEKLINIITSEPVLACPDLDKPFELEVDASAYAVGAILFQRDENKRRRDVGYISKALNPAMKLRHLGQRIPGSSHWATLLKASSYRISTQSNSLD